MYETSLEKETSVPTAGAAFKGQDFILMVKKMKRENSRENHMAGWAPGERCLVKSATPFQTHSLKFH